MKWKAKYMPYLALGGGCLGLLLRVWLFTTGVDERGLFRTEHPANTLSFVVLALALAGLYLCLRTGTQKTNPQMLLPKSTLALVGSLIGACGIGITVVWDIAQSQDRITVICCVLGVLAGLGMALAAIFRFLKVRPNVLFHGLVTIYLMIRLVRQYRLWSAEPELQVYFFPLLASVFFMLTAYYRTTLDNQSGNHRWLMFFNYGSVLLSLSALYSQDWLFYLSFGIWCATCDCCQMPDKPDMDLPDNVDFCLRKLEDAGYEAYVVGGCVRDSLLGLVPQDYDICTSATPEEIAQVFHRYSLVRNGEKHGTIGVVLDETVYEITTFRTEGDYSDNRHPDTVCFVRSLEEDLARRDFTVNAMAYSPKTGYIDLFDGQADLENRILRTVGDPKQRFSEDALRILRGVRFAVRFDLTPEAETLQAMIDLAPSLDHLAGERKFSELSKLLPIINAQQLIQFAPVITQAVPFLERIVGFEQCSPHHAYDVYTHTAHVVEALPNDLTLRFAGLLHDVGKPEVFTQDAEGRGHFYGHAQASAQTADGALWLLRAPTALRQQVVLLIEYHMTPIEADKKLLKRRLRSFGKETLLQLLTLQKADFYSKGVEEKSETDFDQIDCLLEEIAQEDTCLSVKDLAVGGNDLLELGVEAGPIVGACLEHLLDLLQDEEIPNSREALLESARAYLENKENNE